MRALSILQPWAWLIVNGHKPVENRTWYTKFRGEILIHAGKRWGPEQRDDVEWVQLTFPGLVLPDTYERGGVVGKATIVDCVQRMSSPWYAGPHGFLLEGAQALPFVPYRGQLGFFEIPRSALEAG